MYLNGVNLGGWLVLEKWMTPELFSQTEAMDEYYLAHLLDGDSYQSRIRTHRSHYISERDFAYIKSLGFNAVRLPIPYFLFGDRAPFIGCIEELDKAFAWAEKYQLKILLDLHTVPLSQNGFDNGGISGVCRWAQLPEEVEFVLKVLEKLSERYGQREALWGIEVLNEPMTSEAMLVTLSERYVPRDEQLAKGSKVISIEFLKGFYTEAYRRMRQHLPSSKTIVFHDGFNTEVWDDFALNSGFEGIAFDTHQYLMLAELEGCSLEPESYLEYIETHCATEIKRLKQHSTTICGEWTLFNSYALGGDTQGGASPVHLSEVVRTTISNDEKKAVYQLLAKAQRETWQLGDGHFYWNYKTLLDTVNQPKWLGWDCWDLGKAVSLGWYPIAD